MFNRAMRETERSIQGSETADAVRASDYAGKPKPRKVESSEVAKFGTESAIASVAFVSMHEDRGSNWQQKALCAQADPRDFDNEWFGSVERAKKVCKGCVVKEQCLQYALDNDETFGIWGGLSEEERRKLKRRSSNPS